MSVSNSVGSPASPERPYTTESICSQAVLPHCATSDTFSAIYSNSGRVDRAWTLKGSSHTPESNLCYKRNGKQLSVNM